MVAVCVLLALVVASLFSSCAGDGPLDDDIGTQTFSVNDIPPAFGEVLLLQRELAGGAIRVVLEVAPPDQITASPPSLPPEQAHLHLEAQIRYIQDVFGGRVANEFVPYLDVQALIVNDVTEETLQIRLRPHIGIEEGLHYAANVTLPGDAPTYSLSVSITGPLPFGGTQPGTSIDTMIVTHSDITAVIPGSILDFGTTTTLNTSISLAAIIAGEAVEEPDDADGGALPGTSPPPTDPYAG